MVTSGHTMVTQTCDHFFGGHKKIHPIVINKAIKILLFIMYYNISSIIYNSTYMYMVKHED